MRRTRFHRSSRRRASFLLLCLGLVVIALSVDRSDAATLHEHRQRQGLLVLSSPASTSPVSSVSTTVAPLVVSLPSKTSRSKSASPQSTISAPPSSSLSPEASRSSAPQTSPPVPPSLSLTTARHSSIEDLPPLRLLDKNGSREAQRLKQERQTREENSDNYAEMLVVKGGGIKTGGGDTAKKAKTVKEKERNSKKSSTTASSSDPPSGHIDAYLHHMYRQHKTSIQPHLVNHWLGDEAANSPAFRGLTASKNETVKADSDVTISVTPPLYKPRPKSGAAGGGGGGVQTQGVRIVGTAAD